MAAKHERDAHRRNARSLLSRPAPNLPPPRLTVWRSWSHWLAVCDAILCVDSSHRFLLESSNELRRWVSRCRAPHAVYCTAQLAELRDSTVSPLQRRLAYAAALLRLVNGVTDAGQGAAAHSIYEVSARIGLPRSLVDVRHEAAHGALPSLAALHSCAKLAHAWLIDVYWMKQVQHLRSVHALSPGGVELRSSSASLKPPVNGTESAETDYRLEELLSRFAFAVLSGQSGDTAARDVVTSITRAIAQVPAAFRACPTPLRFMLVLPLIDPTSACWPRRPSSPQLLLDAAYCPGGSTSAVMATLLEAWLPLLQALSRAWPPFCVALASVASRALVSAMDSPTRCDVLSDNLAAYRARFSLLLLRLLCSRAWNEFISGTGTFRVVLLCESVLAPASVFNLLRDSTQMSGTTSEGLEFPRSSPSRSDCLEFSRGVSCLAAVLRDLARMLLFRRVIQQEATTVSGSPSSGAAQQSPSWRLAVRSEALALCRACGVSSPVPFRAIASCVFSRPCAIKLRRRRLLHYQTELRVEVLGPGSGRPVLEAVRHGVSAAGGLGVGHRLGCNSTSSTTGSASPAAAIDSLPLPVPLSLRVPERRGDPSQPEADAQAQARRQWHWQAGSRAMLSQPEAAASHSLQSLAAVEALVQALTSTSSGSSC
jgi:hypothetical protein